MFGPGESLHARGGRIPVEVDDELAVHLGRLAQARGLPVENLATDLLRLGLDQEARRQQAEVALAGLTPRQREVARLAAGGRTNRQIARELWLSPETVKTHLRRALEHFDLHSKAELRLLLLPLDGDPLQGAPAGVRSATKRDPLQGAKRDPLQGAPSGVPSGCEDAMRSATKRDPLQGAKRDPLQGAKREARPSRD
jgi:DNA-binding CsgD family transcriptional regulator